MNLITDWEVINCVYCHALFAIPTSVNDEYQNCHNDFYCPYCCKAMHYPQESDKERYKRLYNQEKQCCINAHEESERLAKSIQGYKGYIGRLKKRGK